MITNKSETKNLIFRNDSRWHFVVEDSDSFDSGNFDFHSNISFFVGSTTETSCCNTTKLCRCQKGIRPKEIVAEQAAKVIGLAAKDIRNEIFNCNVKRNNDDTFKQKLKQVNVNQLKV